MLKDNADITWRAFLLLERKAKGFQTSPIDIQKFPNESSFSSKEEEEDALRVQLDNLESDTKLKGNCDHGLPKIAWKLEHFGKHCIAQRLSIEPRPY